MIQCFAPHEFKSSFALSQPPRLLSASKIDSHYTVHPRVLHQHPEIFEVLFVRSGAGVYIIDETRYPIRRGDLIFCNAGTLHDEDPACSENLNTLCVGSTGIQLQGLPPNHLIGSGASPVIPAGEFGETVQSLMLSIYGLLANLPEDCAEICHYMNLSLLRILLLIIQRDAASGGEAGRSQANVIAAQVKNFINAHYDEDFTLQDIADSIHVNAYHLSHVFKDATGYSPKQYTLRRRLGEAQTLLITTQMSMTEISSQVGFGNQSHFNNIFKKYIGMSPGDYRASYVQSAGPSSGGQG